MHDESTRIRFWAKVDRAGDCWPRLASIDASGYTHFKPTNHRQTEAHRVAWELASGEPIPTGLVIGHVCDNPVCVRNDEVGTYLVNGKLAPRFGHLWLGTHQDNNADMVAKGRQQSGKRSERASRRAERRRLNGAIPDGRVGERHYAAKLTEDLVRDIRRRFAAGGVTVGELARDAGVGHPAIVQVLQRKSWSHVVD